ncbi:unnamed protein product (mitochondrion) [Plasmodiophora brassicae]|uniref:Uncharacterized protein n=1 Tax=Plasmodiophora brassicae TaxID=37360 RepID=A0A0G4IXE0_PLABS|nr:hypothetical protein PBRA_007752 [Plasmodiophora brassicae]SPQ99059.1 unnamed protein product [Plasmodiophora brassicae]
MEHQDTLRRTLSRMCALEKLETQVPTMLTRAERQQLYRAIRSPSVASHKHDPMQVSPTTVATGFFVQAQANALVKAKKHVRFLLPSPQGHPAGQHTPSASLPSSPRDSVLTAGDLHSTTMKADPIFVPGGSLKANLSLTSARPFAL